MVRSAGEVGVRFLTLYALSMDNKKRPTDEVRTLYSLIEQFASSERDELVRQRARVQTVGDIVVLNPDLQICTLDEGANLRMELTINNGKGYVPAEQNRPDDAPIGLIAIEGDRARGEVRDGEGHVVVGHADDDEVVDRKSVV